MLSYVRTIILPAILVVVLIIASSACTPGAFTPPAASNPDAAPIEVTPKGLWDAYRADPVAAAAQYEGKTLHFARVQVDQMAFLGEPIEPELYVQEGIDPNIYIVKFFTDKISDIINVRETYPPNIVEITGKVEGLKWGVLKVNIEWLRCIDPPGGDPSPPDEY